MKVALKITKKKMFYLLLLTGLALFIYGFFYEPYCLKVKKFDVFANHWNKNLDGFKVALVSDIHMGSFPYEAQRVTRVVETANSQKPDLIILGGDFVNGYFWNTGVNLQDLANILKKLHAPYGVFAVTGNHDEMYGRKEIIAALESVGIKFLDNKSFKIDTPKGEIYVAGISSMSRSFFSLTKALKDVPQNSSCIFVAHEPYLMPALPRKSSIVLSGHTHGGQVALPFVGPILRPYTMEFGGRDGLFINYKSIPMLVSRGVGTSNMGVRILTKPQIEIVSLFAQDAAKSVAK